MLAKLDFIDGFDKIAPYMMLLGLDTQKNTLVVTRLMLSQGYVMGKDWRKTRMTRTEFYKVLDKLEVAGVVTKRSHGYPYGWDEWTAHECAQYRRANGYRKDFHKLLVYEIDSNGVRTIIQERFKQLREIDEAFNGTFKTSTTS